MPKKSVKASAKSNPSLLGIGFKAGLTVAIGIALLSTLVWIGQKAGNSVSDKERYLVPVASIECDVPPGSDRAVFLTEVRSLSNLPETISAVSPDTPPTLAAAFAKHPWVASVSRVTVRPDRTIRVELQFRTPVLAVRLTGEPVLRVLDKSGVLLPVSPVPDRLPVLLGEYPKADPSLKRAAEITDMLRDRNPRRIEKMKDGWRIVAESGQAFTVSF